MLEAVVMMMSTVVAGQVVASDNTITLTTEANEVKETKEVMEVKDIKEANEVN